MTEPEDVRGMNFPDPLRDDLHFIRAMTAAKWASGNFQMPKSQLGIETDTGKVKVGAGKKWADTAYLPSDYALPVATSSVLGGVKDGAGVTIGVDGTISTDLSADGITAIVALTQAAYDALSPKSATTLYVIT